MDTETKLAPLCVSCGNDGSEAALYLAVDCRWRPETGAWELVERDDSGGRHWDCLACDHQTPAHGADALFPYGMLLRPQGYELPALRNAFAWAVSMAEEAILVRENGGDPEDTPDIIAMHREGLENAKAMLAKVSQ